MKRNLLLFIAFVFCFTSMFGQTSKPYKGKIIGGCVINAIGLFMLYQSVRIANNPVYDHLEGGEQGQRTKSLLAAGIGVACLTVGALNIVKGVKLSRQVDLDVNLADIRLIYRI